tara:strand:+ start:572 stop:1183 length:612 start_codon:yes stop_codon:yes gene_type:complete
MSKSLNSKSSIILASKSPRRHSLLKIIGLKFEIIPSNLTENIDPSLSPRHLAEYLSKEKANKVSNKYKNKIVIGADTIVYFNNKIFGKPKDRDENYSMLKSMSGKTHNVVTGVSLINKNKGIQKTFSQITQVTLRKIPRDELLYYIDNFSTLDKAGGYGIQDWFSVWIKKIDGCYYNVMGMPLSKFYKYYNIVKREINDIKNQ